jgi:hypothetical protein
MWVLNVFLYLAWCFNPPLYGALKAAGAPCYAYIADLGSPGFTASPEAPVCFYDPQPVREKVKKSRGSN